MKKRDCIIYGFFYKLSVIFWVLLFIHSAQPDQEFDNAFVFVTAADMLYYIQNINSSARYFMRVSAGNKKIGSAKFLVTSGNIDPSGSDRL
jgi:hypothetical protein